MRLSIKKALPDSRCLTLDFQPPEPQVKSVSVLYELPSFKYTVLTEQSRPRQAEAPGKQILFVPHSILRSPCLGHQELLVVFPLCLYHLSTGYLLGHHLMSPRKNQHHCEAPWSPLNGTTALCMGPS
jgi:hypothetical protein